MDASTRDWLLESDPAMARIYFPLRWRYDHLRALDYFRLVNTPRDPRMQDATDLLLSRQTSDGRAPCAGGSHPKASKRPNMDLSRPNQLALLLAFIAVLSAYFVSENVFERIPHLEDEIAYVWQANVIASGRLVVESPPLAGDFTVPFVVDHNGLRFGKYPPGWPTLLGIGVRLGLRDWVNPLLAGLGVWLVYRLGRKMMPAPPVFFALFLLITSPLFMTNAGSLMSHAWSLVLAAAFAVAWFDLVGLATEPPDPPQPPANRWDDWISRPAPRWMLVLVCGLALGTMVLTRPLSAVAVALPFGLHGLVLLARGSRSTRMEVLAVGALALLVGLLVFAWQFAVTGDPWLNPYTLWWPFDKIGFGPGYGTAPDGHTPQLGWEKTFGVLQKTGGELLGWGQFWWILLPAGVWALRRKPGAWMVAGIFPALVTVYVSYWVISFVLGPRYYFEGLVSLVLLNAAGLWWALETAGKYTNRFFSASRVVIVVGVALLVIHNLFFFLPNHLDRLTGLYNIHRYQLAPFQSPEGLAIAPAVVVVKVDKMWNEYAGLLELQNADLTSPFIFTRSAAPEKIAAILDAYPGRRIIYYYFDDPNYFYQEPKP